MKKWIIFGIFMVLLFLVMVAIYFILLKFGVDKLVAAMAAFTAIVFTIFAAGFAFINYTAIVATVLIIVCAAALTTLTALVFTVINALDITYIVFFGIAVVDICVAVADIIIITDASAAIACG